MIKKQKFNLPDGKGGSNTHYFDTSADLVSIKNKVLDEEQPLDVFLETFVSDTTVTITNLQKTIARDYTLKPVNVEITVPVDGWTLDEEEISDYRYYFEIEVEGLKPADIVEIFYSRGSISAVLEAGICPSDNEAMEGKFRIYAADIPTSEIVASYVIWKG